MCIVLVIWHRASEILGISDESDKGAFCYVDEVALGPKDGPPGANHMIGGLKLLVPPLYFQGGLRG